MVVVCSRCGTHRILPKAISTAGAAVSLYNDPSHTRAELSISFTSENNRRILNRIKQCGIRFNAHSTVVDIGCSEGSLLESIRQTSGARVVGLDVDERAIARARSHFPQISFHCGLAHSLAEQLPPADVVIASAIIEHVVNPVEFLTEAARLLKPGGQLFLLTPNAGSLHYWIARSWWRELLAIGEHVFLFTPESLQVLAGKCQLTVQSLGTDYDALVLPNMAWPRSLKRAAIIPWSWAQTSLKAACMMLPPKKSGDILFASLRKADGASSQTTAS